MTTKIDIINDAYSQLRISGLTIDPNPDDLVLALSRLENMMAEFLGKNINVGYFFEDVPDLNTLHNVDRKYWYAISSNLAIRLCPDFGKEPSQLLFILQQSGLSFLISSTALYRQIQYPSRFPMGSGNHVKGMARWPRFSVPVEEAPLSAKTISMGIGDTEEFTENFNSFLREGETLSLGVVTADDGLTIDSQSVASPIVNYKITADGSSSAVISEVLQLKIVGTSSGGRVQSRIINFKLTSMEL